MSMYSSEEEARINDQDIPLSNELLFNVMEYVYYSFRGDIQLCIKPQRKLQRLLFPLSLVRKRWTDLARRFIFRGPLTMAWERLSGLINGPWQEKPGWPRFIRIMDLIVFDIEVDMSVIYAIHETIEELRLKWMPTKHKPQSFPVFNNLKELIFESTDSWAFQSLFPSPNLFPLLKSLVYRASTLHPPELDIMSRLSIEHLEIDLAVFLALPCLTHDDIDESPPPPLRPLLFSNLISLNMNSNHILGVSTTWTMLRHLRIPAHHDLIMPSLPALVSLVVLSPLNKNGEPRYNFFTSFPYLHQSLNLRHLSISGCHIKNCPPKFELPITRSLELLHCDIDWLTSKHWFIKLAAKVVRLELVDNDILPDDYQFFKIIFNPKLISLSILVKASHTALLPDLINRCENLRLLRIFSKSGEYRVPPLVYNLYLPKLDGLYLSLVKNAHTDFNVKGLRSLKRLHVDRVVKAPVNTVPRQDVKCTSGKSNVSFLWRQWVCLEFKTWIEEVEDQAARWERPFGDIEPHGQNSSACLSTPSQ